MKEDKTVRKDNDPVARFLRPFATIFAKLVSKTKITSNQLTTFHFLFFVPVILYLILQGKYIYNLIALGFIMMIVFLDLADGSLARIKSSASSYGAWLDKSLDAIFQNLLFVAIIANVYKSSENITLAIIGLILLFGQNMANYLGLHFERDFGFDVYSGSNEFNKKFLIHNNKVSIVDRYLKNIIVPTNFVFIFLFTCRYLLATALLFNRLDVFLIVFAITVNIRWISMWFLYTIFLSNKNSQFLTIRLLRELNIKRNN